MKRIQLVAAEIGSTTTMVSAFDGLSTEHPRFLGQGVGPTTVAQGDVRIGLENALGDLRRKIGEFEPETIVATSSAAGGLVMTVHGLVFDMTVRAAREAALGAGGVIRMVTAGRIRPEALDEILRVQPRMMVLAGGVDYGEEEIILDNARLLSGLPVNAPVVYAGNAAIQRPVADILRAGGKEIVVLPNVFPRIDELNIEPTRRLIMQLFEEKITLAPGMHHIREMVNGTVKPTPGAVMDAAVLLQKALGDLMVIDIGGATTDIHTVAEGSPEIRSLMTDPEPFAKRTVEGDLGVYVNASHLVEAAGAGKIAEDTGLDVDYELARLQPIPEDGNMRRFVEYLAVVAAREAAHRHAGKIRFLYTPSGRITVATGKDLTTVRWLVGTGGALTRLNIGGPIQEAIRRKRGAAELLPESPRFVSDRNYIMAAMGLIAEKYPEQAVRLMLESFDLNGEEMGREISG